MRRTLQTVLFGITAVALAGCWPAPGAGPDRRAFNGLETAIDVDSVASMELAWTADTDGTMVSDPVLSTRGVHVHVRPNESFDGHDLKAFELDGSALWSLHTGIDEFPSRGTITVAGPNIAVTAWFSDNVRPLTQLRDPATGQMVPGAEPREWALEGLRGPRGLFSGPGAHGQTWFGVADDIDDRGTTSRGQTAFQWPAPMSLGQDRIYGSAFGVASTGPGNEDLVHGVRAYALSGGTTDCGPSFDPNFACPLWVAPLPDLGTAPVIDEGETTVFVGTKAGTVHAVDTATGAINWSTSVGTPVNVPPALAYGTLFVGTAGGNLVALDASSGAELWRGATGSGVVEQPAVAGGVVFTASSTGFDPATGSLRGFDAAGCGSASCTPLWSAETSSRITGAPAISAGTLFVGTQDGRLLAYRPAAPSS